MNAKWLTIGEVAKKLGVSERTLRRWEEEGKVAFHRTAGGHRRIAEEELRRLIGLGAPVRRPEAEAPGTMRRARATPSPSKKPRFPRRPRARKKRHPAEESKVKDEWTRLLQGRQEGAFQSTPLPEAAGNIPEPRASESSSRSPSHGESRQKLAKQILIVLIDKCAQKGVEHVQRLVREIDPSVSLPASLKLKVRAAIREHLIGLSDPDTSWPTSDPIEELAEAEVEEYLEQLRREAQDEVEDLVVNGLNYARDRLAKVYRIEDDDDEWERLIDLARDELWDRLTGGESRSDIEHLVDDLLEKELG